jgi:YfiR/HmsC-like
VKRIPFSIWLGGTVLFSARLHLLREKYWPTGCLIFSGNRVPRRTALPALIFRTRGVPRSGQTSTRPVVCKFRSAFARAFVQLNCVFALLVFCPSVWAQDAASAEYRSKANFLIRFLDFIEWPDTAFASAEAPFSVCVRGDFSFGTALAEVARRSSPHGRRIDVRWLRTDQESRGCHVLFVSRSESRRYPEVLHAADAPGVLTIGETPDFLEAGGAMSFIVKTDANQRELLQFEVNLIAATDAQLKISSKLLAVARRVVNRPEPKKG